MLSFVGKAPRDCARLLQQTPWRTGAETALQMLRSTLLRGGMFPVSPNSKGFCCCRRRGMCMGAHHTPSATMLLCLTSTQQHQQQQQAAAATQL